jgi:hypothetical protein
MLKINGSIQSETSPELLMLGFLCIKGIDNLNEKVSILDKFGLTDSDIAIICGCARQSVRNARQNNLRKAKNK